LCCRGKKKCRENKALLRDEIGELRKKWFKIREDLRRQREEYKERKAQARRMRRDKLTKRDKTSKTHKVTFT
jgi:hypothetical protein